MKIKTQQRYVVNKIKPFHINQATSKKILPSKLSLNNNPALQFSFDSFFYRDHVTLNQYSFQNLKQSYTMRRQLTSNSSTDKWRQQKQTQMMQLIEYIDLWKTIKLNRNNILVNRNRKKSKQSSDPQSTYKNTQSTQNTQDQEKKASLKLTNLKNTHRNPSQPKSVRVTQNKNCTASNIRESTASTQNMGKLKKRMNRQIFKMNKQLLRDYLSQEKQYDAVFDSLIKDQDNIRSKLQKIKTLVKVLEKEQNEKQNILEQFSNQNIFFASSQNEQIGNVPQQFLKDQLDNPSQKLTRLNTETYQISKLMENKQIEKDFQLKKMVRFNTQSHCSMQKNRSKKILKNPLNFKKKGFKDLVKIKQCQNKIDQVFEKQWEKIDSQIKLKYRRQAQFSFNHGKKDKFG